MQETAGGLLLSPTDLSRSLSCGHLTGLSLAVARGEHEAPPLRTNPLIDALIERGKKHEAAYVDHLRTGGADLIDLAGLDGEGAAGPTVEAMRAGRGVIVQGALHLGQWHGRPDILRRVERKGAWDWSYEAVDTKLAKETSAGTILQLGLYSDLLREVQGVEPEFFHVVTPRSAFEGERHRVSDYGAYVRLMRSRLIQVCSRSAAEIMAESYPEPIDHCEVCAWAQQCDGRRRTDDHLSLVSGVSLQQRVELTAHGISTLTSLATQESIAFKPKRGSADSLERARQQAKAQHASKGLAIPVWWLREGGNSGAAEDGSPNARANGLARLPEPDDGDVFLDLEGDPFAGEGGREYLFGAVTVDGRRTTYHPWWAFTDGEEKTAFENLIDFLGERLKAHPGMHVYHYGHYEPSALKRLMGRHATRGLELDAFLTGERFIDLLGVVRQALVVGVESYSIKKLEPLYDFNRAIPLAEAREGLTAIELALESGMGGEAIDDNVRCLVAGYNEDDCVSTLRLRDWLEVVRTDAIHGGAPIPRPTLKAPKESEATEKRQRIAALRDRLLEGLPAERANRDDEQQARWLLAYLIDWHDREQKAAWWEYFRLRDLPDEDLFDERQALVGLEFESRQIVTRKGTTTPTGSVIDRYRFAPQEMEIRAEDKVHTRDEKAFGEIIQVDRDNRTIDVKKGKASKDLHPSSIFEHSVFYGEAMEASLLALGEAVAAESGLRANDGVSHRLARRMLLAEAAQFSDGVTLEAREGETQTELAVRAVPSLRDSVLAVQGPPGAGKTYAGARMIKALVDSGKRVGVTATSHKVILNLLREVAQCDASIRVGHKGDEEEVSAASASFAAFEKNAAAIEALRSGALQVLGGTAWLWADAGSEAAVDVLFVDEAGQMSLANVVAATRGARSIVLLGDPQQLEQPEKGSHPDGVGVSALGHMLGSHRTIPAGRGLFLETTWRLPPRIATYTSEVFYEGRLRSHEGLEAQGLSDNAWSGAGLFVVDVDHDANRSASDQEVAAIRSLVAALTKSGAAWTSCKDGRPAKNDLTIEDILVVAPYNAQVSRLRDGLPEMVASIGTVDKFQGQERAVAIYSMATSRPEDAPRGMEFLYSLNRFNVATSRARCAAIVVASPHLFEPMCRSPRQIKLANALCRFRELATRIQVPIS